jgi:hypothetical protein
MSLLVSWLIPLVDRYCIPLDGDRQLAEAELKFFEEGTGTGKPLATLFMMSNIIVPVVPLVAVFTKFDGLVVNEYCELHDVQSEHGKWEKARANAEKTFQKHYLHQIMTVQKPPKAFVKLEGKTVCCDIS